MADKMSAFYWPQTWKSKGKEVIGLGLGGGGGGGGGNDKQ